METFMTERGRIARNKYEEINTRLTNGARK
jgi:hypothetical protein